MRGFPARTMRARQLERGAFQPHLCRVTFLDGWPVGTKPKNLAATPSAKPLSSLTGSMNEREGSGVILGQAQGAWQVRTLCRRPDCRILLRPRPCNADARASPATCGPGLLHSALRLY